ncbi:MmgE/PrpD family protein [Roseomonas sp. CCTCC AB2023176]|uniref:MmgE/PrpD family protein n=1 Tax=Roseomonas sp. CCTCC AB2023176 TaxID=3342640 RepID=UPI0035D65DAA
MIPRDGQPAPDGPRVAAPLSAQVAALLDHLWMHPPAPEVLARARLLLLDTLACAIAGAAAPELRALARDLARSGPGTLRPTGISETLDPPSLALLLGTAACWDEACEGLARAHGRPGLHTIPAVVALALRDGATLGATLDAIVVGYEVAGRLGEVLRIRPGMHVDGTWGASGPRPARRASPASMFLARWPRSSTPPAACPPASTCRSRGAR